MISSLKLFGPPDYPGVLMALPNTKHMHGICFFVSMLCRVWSSAVNLTEYAGSVTYSVFLFMEITLILYNRISNTPTKS